MYVKKGDRMGAVKMSGWVHIRQCSDKVSVQTAGAPDLNMLPI